MLKALGVGQVVLDETIYLKNDLSIGQKIDSSNIEYSIGGPVSSAVIFFKKMGEESGFATGLAKDKEGYKIREYFEKAGIKLYITYQSKTIRNIVLVQGSGVRTIIKDNVVEKSFTIDRSLIKAADIFFLDRHHTEVFDLIFTHKKPSASVIFDPSTDVSERNLFILKLIDFPIVPFEFVLKFGKKGFLENLKELAKFLKKQVIVTLGEFGSLIYDKKISFFPSYKVKAIDVSGAGDIFRAAFGYALVKGKSLEDSIRFANLVASLQCTKRGNSTAIPGPEEIKRANLELNNFSLEEVLEQIDSYVL